MNDVVIERGNSEVNRFLKIVGWRMIMAISTRFYYGRNLRLRKQVGQVNLHLCTTANSVNDSLSLPQVRIQLLTLITNHFLSMVLDSIRFSIEQTTG
jgi:hypothetical protein